MFDKLIESEPAGADFKDRKSYFMVSSLVVGVLFLVAVVFSIYAADIGLGKSGLELSELLAPVDMAATDPESIPPESIEATGRCERSRLSTAALNTSRKASA